MTSPPARRSKQSRYPDSPIACRPRFGPRPSLWPQYRSSFVSVYDDQEENTDSQSIKEDIPMNRTLYCLVACAGLFSLIGCRATCCGYDPHCPLCVSETSGCGDSGCGSKGTCGASRSFNDCGASYGCGCGGMATNCGGGMDCGATFSGCGGCGGPMPTCASCSAPIFDGPVYDGDVIPGQSPAPAPPIEPETEVEVQTTLPAPTTSMVIPSVPPASQPQHTHWIPRAAK